MAFRARGRLGRQARAIGGEPVDQVADARIAGVAHRFERADVRQIAAGAWTSGRGAPGKIGASASSSRLTSSRAFSCSTRKAFDHDAAQLQAVQHIDDAESLPARVIAFDARNDFFA